MFVFPLITLSNEYKHKIYKQQLSITKNVSISQKKTNITTGDIIILMAPTVLVYFISYFFIFISKNVMKTIALDYKTALISLIPTIIFLAIVFIFHKLSDKLANDAKVS